MSKIHKHKHDLGCGTIIVIAIVTMLVCAAIKGAGASIAEAVKESSTTQKKATTP